MLVTALDIFQRIKQVVRDIDNVVKVFGRNLSDYYSISITVTGQTITVTSQAITVIGKTIMVTGKTISITVTSQTITVTSQWLYLVRLLL